MIRGTAPSKAEFEGAFTEEVERLIINGELSNVLISLPQATASPSDV
jgi:hypothetical protein